MSWSKAALGEVAEFRLGKMLDRRKNRGSLRPYLANVNVRWGRFDLENLREMRFEDHEVEKYGLTYGDIVMCEGGEPGRCALWKVQQSGMMIQKALHRIRAVDGVSNVFLFYNLFYRGRAGLLAPLFTGATIRHLPREQLAKVRVDVPPIPTQRRIASIVSAYDDLIENNRRKIQLLERAARLLYREWFVHLRFPGHEQVAVVDGVPTGWNKTKLGEISQLKYGKALRRADRIPGKYPVYGSSGVIGTHQEGFVQGPGIIVGRKGNVGSIHWCGADFYHPIDTVYYIPAERCSFHLFHALRKTQFINTDVAVPGLNRDFASSRRVLIPEDRILRLFERQVAKVYRQVECLAQQNEQLTQARDLLLPRLMNGEITV
ncbi:MAG: restriction endonuclease subunit S [Gemmatimonadetes bacterium]|nr:restriction endonuclease subunit S [Gemmatimonadota bacterium]MYA64468.1 restriction endonuclease subunit S [Gemmatimonadota bacterium]MYB98993.1 restriction endonuclease subunit S [Gemmatimonadota bacterium]MYH54430.1 restriction endonuclease subunit S [Gemmatimonadota bacterium]MYI44786.1 restriction endonuclease subunit S [Gemmatimonadota bacterium]